VIASGAVGLDKPGQRDAELAPLEPVHEILGRGEVDLIAVGRALLADAQWGTKVRERRLDERRPFRSEMRQRLE
jgi:2,4-dienoyl-CoA reductase-like NADH-dependent reductase (Old Yellow Enzyme family)